MGSLARARPAAGDDRLGARGALLAFYPRAFPAGLGLQIYCAVKANGIHVAIRAVRATLRCTGG